MERIKSLFKQILAISCIGFIFGLGALSACIAIAITEVNLSETTILTVTAAIVGVIALVLILGSLLGFIFLGINKKINEPSQIRAAALLDYSVILFRQSSKIGQAIDEADVEIKTMQKKDKKNNSNRIKKSSEKEKK
ncbi:hypothetical protein [Spiroplasma endosymbiont of Labia minor]|uniref:hypothetical protein n=1 Tax=Spiroplasma endosymbiont of Labia minor TaxID=3066305 RepID=UPI0030D154E9